MQIRVHPSSTSSTQLSSAYSLGFYSQSDALLTSEAEMCRLRHFYTGLVINMISNINGKRALVLLLGANSKTWVQSLYRH